MGKRDIWNRKVQGASGWLCFLLGLLSLVFTFANGLLLALPLAVCAIAIGHNQRTSVLSLMGLLMSLVALLIFFIFMSPIYGFFNR
jgi:membrane associated rhomboid family serine protease